MLRTAALRPNVMYGELDPYFIPNALRGAQKKCGVLPKIGRFTVMVIYFVLMQLTAYQHTMK